MNIEVKKSNYSFRSIPLLAEKLIHVLEYTVIIILQYNYTYVRIWISCVEPEFTFIAHNT